MSLLEKFFYKITCISINLNTRFEVFFRYSAPAPSPRAQEIERHGQILSSSIGIFAALPVEMQGHRHLMSAAVILLDLLERNVIRVKQQEVGHLGSEQQAQCIDGAV